MNCTTIVAALGTALISGAALADDGQNVTGVYSDSSNPARGYFQAQQGTDYILSGYAYGQATAQIINPAGQPSPVLHPSNYQTLQALL